MRLLVLGSSLLLLSACGSGAAPAAPAQSPATVAPGGQAPPPRAAEAAPGSGIRALPDVAKELEAERVTGTIALLDTQDGVLGCSDVALCQERVSPASTFKIPHSMIALEAGIVDGPDTLMPWDHQSYANEDWNQDLKFRDAFRLSCLPCFRDVARKVGPAGEREWVQKLGYGNRDTSGDEKFWLQGALRISPVEQIDFLRRFEENQLPISGRTADIVRDIMTLDITESYVLRGKTGSAEPPGEPRELAWFVGFLELGERRVFFATLLTGHAAGVDPLKARRSVTERVLRMKGLL